MLTKIINTRKILATLKSNLSAAGNIGRRSILENNSLAITCLSTRPRYKSDQPYTPPESAPAIVPDKEVEMMLLYRWRMACVLGVIQLPKGQNLGELWKKRLSEINNPESPPDRDRTVVSGLKK